MQFKYNLKKPFYHIKSEVVDKRLLCELQKPFSKKNLLILNNKPKCRCFVCFIQQCVYTV